VNSKKTVLDVLFPRVRAELLRLLLLEPAQQRYVRELMSMSGLALHTIQDELRKLNALGLIVTWSNGYHRFYRANQDHPLFQSLLHIVRGSVKLPSPKQKLLRQPRRRRPAKQRTGRRVVPLPKDWPGKWNLFSNRRKT
jgi:hypothetical protein